VKNHGKEAGSRDRNEKPPRRPNPDQTEKSVNHDHCTSKLERSLVP